MMFSRLILFVVLCATAGCGRFWPNDDRLSRVEQNVEALTGCVEEITLANERQDVNYRGLQGEFDQHRTVTDDAVSQLQATALTADELRDMKEQLKRAQEARANQVNGGGGAYQQPIVAYTPPQPVPLPPVPQQTQALVQYQQPQQQGRPCYLCGKCGRYHYYP